MKLKVISFNIRCCDDPDGHSIAERAPRLAAVTAPFDADVIGLQEYRPAWEPHIEKHFGARYDMFLKYRNQTVDIEASPILWRRDKFECLKTGCFWLSDTPEEESRGWDELYNCYRMCVYAVLRERESGASFAVMNTHFGFGDKGQVASARLIAEYAEKISSLPTFVLGDFNMRPDSVGFAEMSGHFKDVNALTANDNRMTYHAYKPDCETGEHIDYCFIDGKITPVSQTVITDTVDGKFPSDHYGLSIVLEI